MGSNASTRQRSAPPEDITRVMDSLRTLVRALRISTRAVEREIGISGAQLFVLQVLDGEPARSVNELAERTSTHQSSVSTVVSRLVERGLVVRRPAADDARRMEIYISPAGREVMKNAPRTAQIRMIQALQAMEPDRVRTFGQALEELVGAAGFGGLPASMFFEEDASGDG